MGRIDSVQYYDHNAERFHLRRATFLRPESLAPFLAEVAKGGLILDWGCGSGIDLSYIIEAGFSAVGVEASPAMAALANQNAQSAQVVQKNGLFYSPKPNEFDGIWINESLNHFPAEQAQRVIAECFKAIKPNGVLGLVVKSGEGFYEDREDDLMGPSRMIYLYGEKQLCSMIEQTGFTIDRIGKRKDQPDLMMFIARASAKGTGL